MLSDRDIRAEIESGRVCIQPFDPSALQPASIDVRLAGEFRVFRTGQLVDPDVPQDVVTDLVTRPEGGLGVFVLYPGQFVLGCTMECVSLPDDVAGRLEGVSSRGRLGLSVHSTAGFIDPGFRGQITLELSNVNSSALMLRPGMRIGQLCLFRLSSPADRPYGSSGLGSKYQDQRGATASRGVGLVT